VWLTERLSVAPLQNAAASVGPEFAYIDQESLRQTPMQAWMPIIFVAVVIAVMAVITYLVS
jgi:hypothetical protein